MAFIAYASTSSYFGIVASSIYLFTLGSYPVGLCLSYDNISWLYSSWQHFDKRLHTALSSMSGELLWSSFTAVLHYCDIINLVTHQIRFITATYTGDPRWRYKPGTKKKQNMNKSMQQMLICSRSCLNLYSPYWRVIHSSFAAFILPWCLAWLCSVAMLTAGTLSLVNCCVVYVQNVVCYSRLVLFAFFPNTVITGWWSKLPLSYYM